MIGHRLAVALALMTGATIAAAQPPQNPKPPRQAGASAAHSDTQGWTPGAPLPPSRKANIHRPKFGKKPAAASGAGTN